MALNEQDVPYGPPTAVPMDPDVMARIEHAYTIIVNDRDAHQLMSDYYDGDQLAPFAPAHASRETLEIRKRSVMNLMQLAVKVPAQISFADGYFRGDELFPPEWNALWTKHGFDHKQTIIYTAALKYGASYVGLVDLGSKTPRPQIFSTKHTVALFSDPVNDLYPAYLFSILSLPYNDTTPGRAIYMDADRIQYFDVNKAGGKGMFTAREDEDYPHTLGVCPAVRYVVDLDDEGRVRGAIEPLIVLQDAVNQGKFNLLNNNQFSAFKVRWASGMTGEPARDKNGEIVRDDQGAVVYQAIDVSPSRFLSTGAPDGKFGTLDETPPNGFIDTVEELVKQFAVVAQLPPHALLGNLSNLSAETLVAAMAQTMRFGHILKTTWGQSHRALLRLVALDLGLVKVEDNYDGEVRWRDMSDQTFAGQIDGLGKAAQMLGIPHRGLWQFFPGATTGILAQWEREKEKQDQDLIDAGMDAADPIAAAGREARPAPGGVGGDSSGA